MLLAASMTRCDQRHEHGHDSGGDERGGQPRMAPAELAQELLVQGKDAHRDDQAEEDRYPDGLQRAPEEVRRNREEDQEGRPLQPRTLGERHSHSS